MNFQRLSSVLDQIVETGIPCCDCAVYYRGKEVFRHSVGYADREAKVAMRPNLRYNIYSASKVLTVTCAMQLVEQGKMSLSDPLYKYLPEYEHMVVQTADGLVPAESPITIKDLFCMTAGLTYDLDTPVIREMKKRTNGVCPTREVARALAQQPLAFHPGRGWRYSMCHDVLGAVIEVVSGQSFGEYMKEHIFEPCGMKDTGFRYSAEPDERFCAQYVYHPETDTIDRKSLRIPYVFGPGHESGGAGLTSTLEDYCRFQEAFIAGKLLKPETIDLMKTPMLTEEQMVGYEEAGYGANGTYSYGLGVRTVLPDGPVAAPEFGWGGAAGALTMMDTENQITMYYAQHVLQHSQSRSGPIRANELKVAVYEGLGLPWWK